MEAQLMTPCQAMVPNDCAYHTGSGPTTGKGTLHGALCHPVGMLIPSEMSVWRVCLPYSLHR